MRKIKNLLLLHMVIPILDLILGTRIYYFYRLIVKMSSWSAGEIETWQDRKFYELVSHFYENSSFFKETLDNRGLQPCDFQSLHSVQKLPVLTKKIIQQNKDRLIPANLKSIKHNKASTGGSTGNPLQFLISNDSWSYTTANKIYAWQKTGYLYGDKYVALGSSSLFPTCKKSVKHSLYFLLKNGLPLNGVNLSNEKIKEYVGLIRSKKIHYLYGYASAIYLIARYCNKNNFKLDIYGCFPTSEVLTDKYREEIIKAFNCCIMDSYGARDGGITAFEASVGRYHIGYNSFAEIINPTADNSGVLLVTDLLNKAFPFVRYEIGDEAQMNSKAQTDEFNGQTFKKILGRISAIIHLDNGSVLTGPGFTILFKDLNVIAYRTSLVHGRKILVEIQPAKNFSEKEERLIVNTYKKHAGDDCEIEIKYVQEFEVAPSGKRLFFINQ